MQDALVRVNRLKKRYCRNLKRSLVYGLEDIARECCGMSSRVFLRKEEFWATNDVSFELRRGECLGLIGGNGAGKSTLLKQIAGLIKPDSGEIEIKGRVGALIELGSGFNPILSGRENIYINGAILGMSNREINAKLEKILEFADIGDFIDSPVRNYSSGMKVRLGFAVATHLQPDILLIDEILAVGDAAFRSRCYERISELRNTACIIFVSHSPDQMNRICDKAIYLKNGIKDSEGAVADLYQRYMADSFKDRSGFLTQRLPIIKFEARLSDIVVSKGQSPLKLQLRFESEASVDCTLRIGFLHPSGVVVTDMQEPYPIRVGENSVEAIFPTIPLRDGDYYVSICLIDPKGSFLVWAYMHLPLRIATGLPAAQSLSTIPNSELRVYETT